MQMHVFRMQNTLCISHAASCKWNYEVYVLVGLLLLTSNAHNNYPARKSAVHCPRRTLHLCEPHKAICNQLINAFINLAAMQHVIPFNKPPHVLRCQKVAVIVTIIKESNSLT